MILVESDSQPGFFYEVTGEYTLYPKCTCPAGKHGSSCKHTLPYIALPEEERMVPTQTEEPGQALAVRPQSMAVQAQQKREILAAGADGWKDAFYLGEGMLASGLLPDTIKNPAAAALVIMTAADLGIPASQAFQYVAIIKNKPMLMARMVQALINRSGKGSIQVVKRTPLTCEVVAQRSGRRAVTVEITMQMAVTAGWTVNKLYQTHPANMLYARAITTAGWMEFADILAGMDVAEGDEYLGYEAAQETPAYSATVVQATDTTVSTGVPRDYDRTVSNSPIALPDDSWIDKAKSFLGDAGLTWADVGAMLGEPASKKSMKAWLERTPEAMGAPAVVLVSLTKELYDSTHSTTPLEDALEASLDAVTDGQYTELPPQEAAQEAAQGGFPEENVPFD